MTTQQSDSIQRAPSLRKIGMAMVGMGVLAQVVQALLIRDSLVAFFGNEVSLGAFFASWLWWVSWGSLFAAWGHGKRLFDQPIVWLRVLVLILPLLLGLELLVLRLVRGWLEVSAGQFVALGDLLWASLLINLPLGLAFGLAFPIACRLLSQKTALSAVFSITRLYALEAVGALMGGLLFTFVLLLWLGPWQSLGVVTLLAAWLYLILGGGRGGAIWLLLLAMILVSPLGQWIGEQAERLRFSRLQPGVEYLGSGETRYGHFAMGCLGHEYLLFDDGRISAQLPDPTLVEEQAAYSYSQVGKASRILLFGGADLDLVRALLRYPVEHIDLVEPDRERFELLRSLLPDAQGGAPLCRAGAEDVHRATLADPRLKIHFEDGRHFLNTLKPDGRYDLALVFHTSPDTAYSNRYFTREFYRQIARRVTSKGVFCTEVDSASNYLGQEVLSYSATLYHTLKSVFPAVLVQPGDRHRFCASNDPDQLSADPEELARRYRAIPLTERRFPDVAFKTLLPADRVKQVERQLAEGPIRINSDAQPVSYYLNMVLWGKFTASGFVEWIERLEQMGMSPFLLPPLLYAALLWLRGAMGGLTPLQRQRKASGYALAMVGLAAMAAQLIVLYSYQATIGHLFAHIALLNGLFMTGLALGAWLALRLFRAGSLTVLLGGIALGLWAMPELLNGVAQLEITLRPVVLSSITLVLGLVTGAIFPLAVNQTHAEQGDVQSSSGLSEAADSLGGAVGGLLAGTLLIPLLGIEGSSRLLALLVASSALLTLASPWQPAWWVRRGGGSLPWPRFSWTLILLVLTIWGWFLLAQQAQPGPQVHFSPDRLVAVSGQEGLQLRPNPFVHYISSGKTPNVVAFASQPLTPDVQGYGGPINLLMGLGRTGELTGVSLVSHDETPSYTLELPQWLEKLKGKRFSEGGLSLDTIDAISGATVTSQAVLDSLNQATAQAGPQLFADSFPVMAPSSEQWLDWRVWTTLALLLLFIPVYLSGSDRWRVAYQLLSLFGFGLLLNVLITEMDLWHLSRAHWPAFPEGMLRWLLLGFVAISSLLLGQVWCGFCCPFGALQECSSRLGRYFRWRRYPDRHLDLRLRYLKYLLLAALLVLAWLTDSSYWLTLNPMQHIFSGHLSGWLLGLTLLVLAASVVYYRFWCRYLCPMGALLGLANRLALIQQRGPQRRIERCDLGVQHAYDPECIRCHRCIDGDDLGVRGHKIQCMDRKTSKMK